jgi:hypothetical protein
MIYRSVYYNDIGAAVKYAYHYCIIIIIIIKIDIAHVMQGRRFCCNDRSPRRPRKYHKKLQMKKRKSKKLFSVCGDERTYIVAGRPS